jgi:hypothetical protein
MREDRVVHRPPMSMQNNGKPMNTPISVHRIGNWIYAFALVHLNMGDGYALGTRSGPASRRGSRCGKRGDWMGDNGS